MDLIRVAGAFALVFVVLPYLVWQRTGQDKLRRLAESFTAAVLFVELVALALGRIGFCLRGSMTAAYVGFLGAAFLVGGQGRVAAAREWWRRSCFQLLRLLEGRKPEAPLPPCRISAFKPPPVLLAITLATLVGAAWYPLQNVRFQQIISYSRALSLEILVRGQLWEPDGTVAFLAPVLFASGLEGDVIIRYSNVALALVLVLAAGYAVYRHTSCQTSAALAISVAALIPLGGRGHPEMSSAEIASIFWLLALGFARESRWYSFLNAALGLSISLMPDIRSALLIVAVCGIAAGSRLLTRLAGRAPRLPMPATLGLAAWIIYQGACLPPAQGPFQYESAARAVKQIVSECLPNDWLVVSPVHETPLLYGRGWHLELMEFVDSFQPDQLASPEFRFPYAPQEIFVFVEKIPLAGSAGSDGHLRLMPDLDRSVLAYQSSLGRAAVEFQAGRLMAAYAATHPKTVIFFEDEQLIVYRVRLA
jgi:hypothetical protein